ncbi:hypothetical protein M569_07721, partial [Genlisea aurea]
PSSNLHQLVPPPAPVAEESDSRQSNVLKLLARRELSPHTKRTPNKFWKKASSRYFDSSALKNEFTKDVKQELRSWAEAESLLHLSAKYCPLLPPPRSTIAAAFSPDGKTLASTHGDHTVKIIDCRTGKCLKVLSGHRRTPWVVRFHPLYPEVLASGSLDHEVRLWDAKTAECIGSRDFFRPIASIAFHALGEILAVASGHKLYIWHYNRRGEASSPSIILKTRRSLRAVHFHPNAAPFLLTAEVNDLDSSDPSMTLATSPGYLRYPPPVVYLTDSNSSYRSNPPNELPIMSIPFIIWPSFGRGDAASVSQPSDPEMSSGALHHVHTNSSGSVRLFTYSTPSGQYELVLSPINSPVREEPQNSSLTRETDNDPPQPAGDSMENDLQTEDRSNQYFPFGDPAFWDVPFLQGWLIGQSQATQRAMQSQNVGPTEGFYSSNTVGNSSVAASSINSNTGNSRVSGISGNQNRSRTRARTMTPPNEIATFNAIPREPSEPFLSQVPADVATSIAAAAAAAAAELPCTVKLRIWFHDVKNPCKTLDSERCRLMIPHAVLCSEMGAHFSPCGRFLAVCVACILPNIETEPPVFQGHLRNDIAGVPTSPTRHPISAHQVMYELRIYSLEEATFGSVLASRAIRAAHCLTSIQFSPTSEHLLLAYGRRHSSLLRSVVIDGDATVPIYTILEIYRVSDMELVRILPNAEDEVNVACFHPEVGGGFVYGTKEGKLRILQCDLSDGFNAEEANGSDDTMFEVPTYGYEG